MSDKINYLGKSSLEYLINKIKSYVSSKSDENNLENQGIFFWDGKSSDINPDNIALWQKIYDTSKVKDVFVIESMSKKIYFINKNSISNSAGNKSIKGILYNVNVSSTVNGASLTTYTSNCTITLNSNDKISSVGSSSVSGDSSFPKWLSTKDDTTIGKDFIPTLDNHPANKKYVDDSIAAAITTTLEGSY